MFNKLSMLVSVIVCVGALSGCQSQTLENEAQTQSEVTSSAIESTKQEDLKIHEVSDEHYDAFVSDVYSHPQDYEGLNYRIRAYYRIVEHDGTNRNYLFKGTDERWMGFEIESELALPSPESMILVEGTFFVKEDEGQQTPYLKINSLEVIKEK